MKKQIILLGLLSAILLTSCNSMKNKADILIHNTRVYSVDNAFTKYSCLAVADGKILAVGGEEILDKYDALKVIDGKGMFVYPGFYDAHCHFLSYGLGKMQRADLTGTLSMDEVLERVQQHAETNPSEWIEGRGWDQNDWENKAFPDRSGLDEIFPDRPVLLIRIDGHAALANGEALRRAGITANTSVVGGEVILKNGIPSGVLIDNAIELVKEVIPETDSDIKAAALFKAQEDCFAAGLTSVMDAGLHVDEIQLIDSLQKAGRLKMKINAMLSPMDSTYADFMADGIYKTDRLHVNSVKLYADGALGSRGACMIDPYTDDPGNHGLIMYPEAYYREVIENALKFNYQVNTHAIGDSGNRFVLDLYGEYLKGKNDRRWRIEHSQIIHEDDFHKFADFSIIPSIQATHATSDMYWAGDRIGEKRMKGAYAYKRLLALNDWIPNGTDFPIEQIYPLHTFYASVARKDLSGYPEEGFQMENALSREESLRSMTIWAAKSAFEEAHKGSLEPGKDADILILDTDLMEDPIDDVPDARVLYTISHGEIVYQGLKE